MRSGRLQAAPLGAASPRAQRQPQTQRLQRQRGPAAGPGDGRLAWAVQPGHVEGDWQALARVREEPICVLVWGKSCCRRPWRGVGTDGCWSPCLGWGGLGGGVSGVSVWGSCPWGHAVVYTWEASRVLQGQPIGETLGARCERRSRQAVRHDDDGDDDVDAHGGVVATVVDDHDEVDGHDCDGGDGGGGVGACAGDCDYALAM